MTNPDFSDVGACVFDAYGTLFDVHSAVGKYKDRLGEQADSISMTWRTKQLEYTWLRSLMKRHTDFWQITGDGLDYSLESHGVVDAKLRDDLMQAYLQLDAYPEVVEVLKTLKSAGMRLAILSNGSPKMLESAVDNAGIGSLLDANLSVEDVGIFKPDPSVYQLAVESLGVTADRVSFQSSNAWDVAGASSFGFRVAWINRFGQKRERLSHGPHAELSTLAELPATLGLSDS